MRELRALGPEERRTVYEHVYREAFPLSELRPLASMERLIAAGEYLTLGLYEGREGLAYASVWRDGRFYLIDYLCVPREARNRGNGSALLRCLRESSPPGSVFFGESEAPTGDAERDALVLRRLQFCHRCGAVTLPYDTALFGVHYKTLAWCDDAEDTSEIMARHAGFYRRSLPRALYDRAVIIPYDGAALPEFDHWEVGEL